MDWKAFYAAELGSADAERLLEELGADLPESDAGLDEALDGGVVSVPHTTLRSSGAMIARAVETLYRRRVKRVVALGVLHGGTLPEPHRDRVLRYRNGEMSGEEAVAAFADYGGAFLGEAMLQTPFGGIPAWRPRGLIAPRTRRRSRLLRARVRDEPELLAAEFSLDLFLALLARRGRELGRTPPKVLPLFVGLARDPVGLPAAAHALGEWIRHHRRHGTAVVASGDLVHYGHGYSEPGAMQGLSPDPRVLALHFRTLVRDALDSVFRHGDDGRFLNLARGVLRCDQTDVVPVIADIAQPNAHCRIHEFTWADYGPILGQPDPCLVASALYTVSPAA